MFATHECNALAPHIVVGVDGVNVYDPRHAIGATNDLHSTHVNLVRSQERLKDRDNGVAEVGLHNKLRHGTLKRTSWLHSRADRGSSPDARACTNTQANARTDAADSGATNLVECVELGLGRRFR